MTSLAHLHSITNRILNAKVNAYGELFAAAGELYNFLLQVTGTDAEENVNREKIHLNSGHAIGLTWAAMCIKDFMRTKKFMDGIYEAVNDAIQKNNDRPVHILYAGTGPFATLVLPLTARFSPAQLQFTFLEVSEHSFDCLQRLVAALELEPYVRHMEKTDATIWKTDTNDPVDIFISETMNNGLAKEPQAAIFMNIIPQLRNDAIIIPEKINLKAALIDPVKRMHEKMNNEKYTSTYVLDNIFELSKETVVEHTTAFKRSGGNYKLPGTTVAIPADKVITHFQFCILTHITVYNTVQLLTDESPLTMPLKLTELKDPIPQKINCHYETGENPGVRFSLGLRP